MSILGETLFDSRPLPIQELSRLDVPHHGGIHTGGAIRHGLEDVGAATHQELCHLQATLNGRTEQGRAALLVLVRR